MKKQLLYFGIAVAFAFSACKDEPTKKDDDTVSITKNISENTTWEEGKVYILGSRVSVLSGVTLTIQPGAIVKGEAGSGANATALIITRGAKLMAEGTAEKPIIFTSVADEIEPGQIASPNLDPDLRGLWGGLLILGNAPISADAESMQIEGIPASDQNGLYGGTANDDNSGVIKYVSIRHGGADLAEGDEINGLTLGGVGSGTTIENIEVVGNKDDGVEFFGGSVAVKNVLVWNADDDGLDVDQAFSGSVDNFIIICGGTDHALEIDGAEGTATAGTSFMNGTIIGDDEAELADFRDGAMGSFSKIFFTGFYDPANTDGRGDFSFNKEKIEEVEANVTAGTLTFANLEIATADSIDITTIFKNGTDAFATKVSAPTNAGANESAFSWTWASKLAAF